MPVLLRLLVLCLPWSLAAGAAAEDASPTCYTIDTAMRAGARADPAVEVVRARRLEAEADLETARALRRPRLSTFARSGWGDQGLVDSQIEKQVGLRGSLRLLDFGDARLAREAAREEIRAREFQIEDAEVEAAREAALAYIGLMEARAQLEATRERTRYFADQLEALEALLEEGGATSGEIAEVGAQLADGEAQVLELRFLIERFATLLASRTGTAGEPCGYAPTEDVLARRLDPDGGEPGVADGPGALLQEALSRNPEIQALDRLALSLAAELEREQRGRLPVVELVGITSYTDDDSLSQVRDEGNWRQRVGIDVTVPLYAGGSLAADRRSAAARRARAQAEAQEARRGLREDLLVGLERIASLRAQTRQRDLVTERKGVQFEDVQFRYDRGLVILPRLVEIRLEYEDAALQAIATRYELLREMVAVLAMAGRLPQVDGRDGN